MSGRIRIGTSGWSYAHWKGRFYPERIGQDAMLASYARTFDCVELNATFYRLPSADTLSRWARTVPADFAFAVKAGRHITHLKKLKDSDQTLVPFLDRVRTLGDRLGPILFQLPPNFRYNGERLAELLGNLPGDLRCVFEFRDASWINDESLAMLREHGAGLCYYDLAGEGPAVGDVTGGIAYLRLHGPESGYAGAYDDAALQRWAKQLREWRAAGHDCWCFFDNDTEARAPADAQRLRALLDAE